MKIVELDTGLFPDGDRVREAVAAAPGDVVRFDLTRAESPADWDAVVAAVLAADRVVTV